MSHCHAKQEDGERCSGAQPNRSQHMAASAACILSTSIRAENYRLRPEWLPETHARIVLRSDNVRNG